MQVLGWAFVVLLALQTIYAAVRNHSAYVQMAAKAHINPETGEMEDGVLNPLYFEKLATRYMWRCHFMLAVKVGIIIVVVSLLLK